MLGQGCRVVVYQSLEPLEISANRAGVHARHRDRVAMALRTTGSFNQKSLTVWRIGRQRRTPRARSGYSRQAAEVRIKVREDLVADLAFGERGHDPPWLSDGLPELVETQLASRQVWSKSTLAFHTVTILASVFGNAFPSSLAGLSVALSPHDIGLKKGRQENQYNRSYTHLVPPSEIARQIVILKTSQSNVWLIPFRKEADRFAGGADLRFGLHACS